MMEMLAKQKRVRMLTATRQTEQGKPQNPPLLKPLIGKQ
jgi:hypothetical protein